MSRFIVTAAMDAFLREHYMLPAGKLAAAFNKQFGTDRTSTHLHGMRRARGLSTGRTGRFYKGQPYNPKAGSKSATSTSFTKGQRPRNAVDVGTETKTQDGYLKIKIAEPNVWAFKHRLVWEKHHGEIKKGFIIWFKDYDRTNCDIDNLQLIPRSLQVRYNKAKLREQPEELKETVRLIAEVIHAAGQIKANNKEGTS